MLLTLTLMLMLVFEFTFGWAQGKPLPVILEAYTFKDGNLWLVIVLITAVSPCIAAWLKGVFSSAQDSKQ